MFGKRKRPWGKYGRILRVERNGGDVQFQAEKEGERLGYGVWWYHHLGTFESLVEAETALAEWYADWWPKQVKRTRRA